MDSNSSTSVKIDDMELLVPAKLYKYLGYLSDYASRTVEDYIKYIIGEEYSQHPQAWNSFPDEAVALLQIYMFCHEDAETRRRLQLKLILERD